MRDPDRPAQRRQQLTLLAFIPWVVFTDHCFFTGAGPVLAPISYGKVP